MFMFLFRTISMNRASFNFLFCRLVSRATTLGSQWTVCPSLITCAAIPESSGCWLRVWYWCSRILVAAVRAVSPIYTLGHVLHPTAYTTPGSFLGGIESFASLISDHFSLRGLITVRILCDASTLRTASLTPLQYGMTAVPLLRMTSAGAACFLELTFRFQSCLKQKISRVKTSKSQQQRGDLNSLLSTHPLQLNNRAHNLKNQKQQFSHKT